MTLQFFRRHKKWFFVLMALAVFSIVVWQSISMLPEAWARLQMHFGGRRPNDPDVFVVHGKPVSRYEALMARANLEAGERYGEMFRAYAQLARTQGIPDADRKLAVLGEYTSVMSVRYLMAKSDEKEREKVFHATLVLLQEAKEAGVRVTPGMVQAYLNRVQAAGVEMWFWERVFQHAFKNSQALMLSALQQEMTISLYMRPLAGGAKVLPEDVDKTFLQDEEKIEYDQAIIRTSDFLKDVPEPTDEKEIAAQFEEYKGKLPDETPSGFGYRVPDRIKFSYLEARVDEASKSVEVTEQEIKDYYETNKDQLFEEKAGTEPAKTPGTKPVEKPLVPLPVPEPAPAPGSQGTSGSGSAAPQPPAGGASPASGDGAKGTEDKATGSGAAEEAKKLNAPQDEAATTGRLTDAPAATGEAAPQPEPPAAPTPPAQPSPELSPLPQPPLAAPLSGLPAPQPPLSGLPAPAPAKKYQPLEQVRDQIRSKLIYQEAAKRCLDKSQQALEDLMRQPRLELENVADGQYLKAYESKGFVSRQDVFAMSIGSAGVQRGPQVFDREPFGSIAFSIAPLEREPKIFLNRPVGVLTSFMGDCYVFKVTAVEPAHEPASLAVVRSKVIEDLKKKAAYKLAQQRATEVLSMAKEKGLSTVVKELTLDAGGKEFPVTRRAVQYGNPVAATVFEVFEDGGKLGKVDSAAYDRVVVFEIKNVQHPAESLYRRNRRNVASQTVKTGQDELFWRLSDPNALLRDSNFKTVRVKGPGGREEDVPLEPKESRQAAPEEE